MLMEDTVGLTSGESPAQNGIATYTRADGHLKTRDHLEQDWKTFYSLPSQRNYERPKRYSSSCFQELHLH